LLVQIGSAKLVLYTKNNQVDKLKEHELNPTSMDVLKQQLKTISNVIQENDKVFDALKKNQDHYWKKKECEKIYQMGDYLLWESKLEALQCKCQWVEKKWQGFNLQIVGKEKIYYNVTM